MSIAGITPNRSANVQASAGSGKTWLLVTRLLRLLLAGEKPGAILALTFTRKAAGEMQMRLRDRLQHMALCTEDELTLALAEIDCTNDPSTRQRARQAFESLLLDPVPLRTSTFHSFCQDWLQQFAFEANLPSNFSLLEGGPDEQELIQLAWLQLLAELTQPEHPERHTLSRYLAQLGNLANAEKALRGFLGHRLDWWAYQEACQLAAETPTSRLQDFFQPAEDDNACYATAANRINIDTLKPYAEVLLAWGTKTGLQLHQDLLTAVTIADPATQFKHVQQVLLTQKNEPRNLMRFRGGIDKKLATTSVHLTVDDFLALHEQWCEVVLDTRDALLRRHNYQINADWLTLGQLFLDQYQQLKNTRGLLDFSDLEWQTLQLLSDADLGQWIQYKLDQRVQHVLIDEFQDTSPTQWRLLEPLLRDIVAAQEQQRSLFIVGDDKQSIYGFRRADPALLTAASDWMQQQTADTKYPAETITLAKSYRSSPAILEPVNALFTRQFDALNTAAEFPQHATHQQDLPGSFTVLPVVEDHAEKPEKISDIPAQLRNPLLTPRVLVDNERPYQEGRQIAAKIKQFIANATPIAEHGEYRPATYGDIIILLRKRTHAEPIEQALRTAGIPFIGADRDSFASSSEIEDLLALLRLLHSPWDNLACAQVLRSPLFAWSDSDIMQLVAQLTPQQSWWDGLLNAPALCPRTTHLLSAWQHLARRLPTHDLIDHILHSGECLARYRAAFPVSLHTRLHVNFQRLCELALATDGGRYPSLRRFIERAEALEAALPATQQAVQMLTIHAAKGLEAPIVFVANTASQQAPNTAWEPLVHWPTGQTAPSQMLLRPSQTQMDQSSALLVERQAQREAREQLNLLYVALTRAKQHCVVSGFRGQRQNDHNSWWDCIKNSLADLPGTVTTDDHWQYLHLGDNTASTIDSTPHLAATTTSPPALPASLSPTATDIIKATVPNETTPSASQNMQTSMPADTDGSIDGRLRGIALHALLEHRSQNNQDHHDLAAAQQFAASITQLPLDDPRWPNWQQEVTTVLSHPDWAWLFPNHRNRNAQSWNELPVYAQAQSGTVYGVVDRVVIMDDTVHCVDYKTQRAERVTADETELVTHYTPQLAAYRHALQTIWPDKTIRTYLLFTSLPKLIETHAD